MRTGIVVSVVLLGALLGGPAAAASGWRDVGGRGDAGDATAREVYRDNLVGCVARMRGCDRSRLSQEDRDYLVYEMRDQRFDAETVRQVVDVRMAAYGRPVAVVQGRATGPRYPAARADAAPSGGGIGSASNVIGLGKGLADIGGEIVRQIAAPSR